MLFNLYHPSEKMERKTFSTLFYRSFAFFSLSLLALLWSPSLAAQCTCATNSASLDWDVLNWPVGSLNNDYDISITNAEMINVEIDISTVASGSWSNNFGFNWPQVDQAGGSPEFFGPNSDLGILFDPAAGQGESPIIIKVIFDKPVECLSFEISDIDISQGTRKDRVKVTSNNGDATMTALQTVGVPTFAVTADTATATGLGGVANNGISIVDDYGSVIVDFGTTAVDTVFITYSEVSNLSDPSGRGIGVLGSFSFCPPPLDGSISGKVWEDTNGNGLGNIPIPLTTTINLLDTFGNAVLDDLNMPITASTLADGTYSFSDVEPDTYWVEEVDPTGYSSVGDTDGGDDNITVVVVGAADDVTGVDFIDELAASVSGKVWEDTNGNGSGNQAIPVTTEVWLINGTDTVKTFTALDGTYVFANVGTGTYQVEEVDPSGYASVSDTDAGDPNNTTVVVSGGADRTGIDFIDAKESKISGNVYNDTDGLEDSTVDGAGTYQPGGDQLYIYLLDDMNATVTFVAVDTDGSFEITGITPGAYTVYLNDPGASPNLPKGWVNTGENHGAGSGNDGSVDGFQSITMNNTDVSQVNFGIEEPPSANTVSATTQGNPGGTNQVVVPDLGGFDSADGTLGTGNTMIISTLPTNASLYYNGVLITGIFTISNYDPSLLMVDPMDGDISVSFTYQTVDAAAIPSAPATVTMPFSISLPVTWLDFQVQMKNDQSLLSWTTANEWNNSHFEIERSTDGETFDWLGEEENIDHGNYSFLDKEPAKGANYYRIKQVDLNGATTYSPMRMLTYLNQSKSRVYPNPSRGEVHFESTAKAIQLDVYSSNGTLVLQQSEPGEKIDLGMLNKGIYYLQFRLESGASESFKIKLN